MEVAFTGITGSPRARVRGGRITLYDDFGSAVRVDPRDLRLRRAGKRLVVEDAFGRVVLDREEARKFLEWLEGRGDKGKGRKEA